MATTIRGRHRGLHYSGPAAGPAGRPPLGRRHPRPRPRLPVGGLGYRALWHTRTHLTPSPRYLELADLFPSLVSGPGGTLWPSCPRRRHLQGPGGPGPQPTARQLPVLLAVSANSPFRGGRGTGWASWRYRLQGRWPTARPLSACASAAAYDAVVHRLVRHGAALDERSVYFLARLSPRYRTVEVRIADVCLAVEDAVLLADLVRALVMTAIWEAEAGLPVRSASAGGSRRPPGPPPRHGLGGPGLDPWSGATVAQRTLLDRLLEQVQGALARSGDDREIAALVACLDQRGTGAARQGTMRTSGDLRGRAGHRPRPCHPGRLRKPVGR